MTATSSAATSACPSVTIRPRRSVLYMPGSNARALEKAQTLPADALIFDLEDAVTADAKALARTTVVTALRERDYGRRERIVRVNGLNTPWGYADMAAVATAGADAVALPKVDSADAVRQAERLLTAAGAPAHLAIWAMIETPLGVLNVADIAAATPRLTALVMGTSDLAKELHAAHTPDREPLVTSLGLCLLAARAYGLAILDGVHLDLQDMEGFAATCHQAAAMGFDGKTLIHPKTIEPANLAFAPSPDEVSAARRLIEAYYEAAADGKGVVVVDGKLVELLHVQNARRLVALAEAIGLNA